MFLARRELRFAWGRFALMGSVIALVAVLTVMLSGLATGLVDDGISALRALPVTHLAFQPSLSASVSSTRDRPPTSPSTSRCSVCNPVASSRPTSCTVRSLTPHPTG